MRKKKRKCDRCGGRFDPADFNSSAGMCDDCYAENWDAAFSSQADYSDKMFDEQLERERKSKDELNRRHIAAASIRRCFDKSNVGKLKCARCSRVRTSWNRRKPMSDAQKERRIARLRKKCPGCGAQGYLVHE